MATILVARATASAGERSNRSSRRGGRWLCKSLLLQDVPHFAFTPSGFYCRDRKDFRFFSFGGIRRFIEVTARRLKTFSKIGSPCGRVIRVAGRGNVSHFAHLSGLFQCTLRLVDTGGHTSIEPRTARARRDAHPGELLVMPRSSQEQASGSVEPGKPWPSRAFQLPAPKGPQPKWLGYRPSTAIFRLPTGSDRERNERSAGLRTFSLSPSAAETVMGENPEATARVVEGWIPKIGFIGGGAILVVKKKMRCADKVRRMQLLPLWGCSCRF